MMTYDWIMVGVLVFAVIRGAMKGMIWQVATIAAVVLCFVFAETLSISLAPMIPLEPPANRWVAMFLLYLGFSFLSFGIAWRVRNWMEKVRFQEYDRHLGAIFGFIKGVVFCLVITFFSITLSAAARETIFNSHSGHVAAIVMDRLHPVMPDELHEVLEPYIHQLDRPGLDLRYQHDHADADQDDDLDGEEHGEERSEKHAGGDEPGNSPGETPTHRSAANGTGNELSQLIDALPIRVGGELRGLVLRALRNTTSANREKLLEKLSSGLSDEMHNVATLWKNGKPETKPETPEPKDPEVNAAIRSKLLGDISAVYTDDPDAQDSISEEIELSFSGLPERVVLNVLRDWRADLLELEPDPDPETDESMPLPDRIVRQLTAARIPLSSLDTSLLDISVRERLR